MEKVSGYSQTGGQLVVTSGTSSVTYVQKSFPSSTITVYNSGTVVLATIASDSAGTPKANSFTAGTDGSWSFWVAPGRYDIQFSGTGISVPFTISSIDVISAGQTDIFNVKDYGAIGNGVIDDTVAIQAAITAATTQGSGIVYFPYGTYKITSTLTAGLDGSFTGVSFVGSNGYSIGSVINWAGSTSGTAIYIKKGRLNRFENLFLNNSVAKGTTIGVLLSGPGTGTQTSGVGFYDGAVRGFGNNVQIGEGSGSHAASEVNFHNFRAESGTNGIYIVDLNSLNINLTGATSIAANTTAGINNQAAANVVVNGGAFSGNGADFVNVQAGSNMTIIGVRTELKTDGTGLFVATSNNQFLTVIGCSIIPAMAAATPIIQAVGTVTLIGNICDLVYGSAFYGNASSGGYGSLTMIGNALKDTNAQPLYVDPSFSGMDGLHYNFFGNSKWNSGSQTGLYPNEEGVVVWPGMLSKETLLKSTASVDMNTATATTLFTAPTGRTCTITKVIVRNASASLTTASYSFGWTSAAYSDVIANATHTELTGSTLATTIFPKVGQKVGASAGTFKVLMNTLQGGASTTSIDVYGYLSS